MAYFQPTPICLRTNQGLSWGEAECRVQRGAKMLDERRPGWWRQIDPDRLDIRSNDCCVLGLLFGRFSLGRRMLQMENVDAVEMGFGYWPGDLSDHDIRIQRQAFDKLNMVWKKLIAARQYEAVMPRPLVEPVRDAPAIPAPLPREPQGLLA